MNILKQASFSRQDAKVLSRTTLYSGFLQVQQLELCHQRFNHPSPLHIKRELIQRPAAAGALLYNDQQRQFALIEQFRVGAIDDPHSAWQLEIVAGVLDGDESPEQCIQRECMEEAGCQVEHLQHLFTFYPSAGACSEIFHLYAAHCHLPPQGQIGGVETEGEDIFVHVFDYHHIDDLLYSNRLRNAPVIMAIQWLKHHIQQE